MIKRKKKFIICFLLVIISFFINVDNSTKVYFIDVGQGDSALIVSENNKSILIDTGGVISYYKDEWKKRKREFNLMTSSIIPFFKSIGVNKIDYLFLTHGDNDHLGFSIDLINNFNVNNIYINRGKVNYAESKLDYKIFYDEYLKVDNIEIYSLNNIDYGNENDNSLVFLIKIYNYNILFTADASYYVEDDILNKYDLPKVDILKVGHHGSDTSTGVNLINKINPDISIISVGKNNKYGHPSNNVLELLEESKIYRTDMDGSVVITFSEDDYMIDNFSPGGSE